MALTPEKQQEIIRYLKQSLSDREIAEKVGVNYLTVQRIRAWFANLNQSETSRPPRELVRDFITQRQQSWSNARIGRTREPKAHDPALVRKVLALHRQGMTTRAIADEVGKSREWVRVRIAEAKE